MYIFCTNYKLHKICTNNRYISDIHFDRKNYFDVNIRKQRNIPYYTNMTGLFENKIKLARTI